MPTCTLCGHLLRHTHAGHYRCDWCGQTYEAVILPKPTRQDIDYFNLAVEHLRRHLARRPQCDDQTFPGSSKPSAAKY